MNKILFILIAIFLFIVTMYDATAFTLDTNVDKIITTQDVELNDFFIIMNPNNDILVSVENDGFVSFEGKQTLMLDDFEKLYDNTYIVKYNVYIPDKIPVDVYNEIITITDVSGSEELNVKIIVQKSSVVKINNFLNKFINLGFTNVKVLWIIIIIFLIIVILYIILLFSNVRS